MIRERPLFFAYAALTAVAVLLLALPKLGFVVTILTLGIGGLLPSIWLYVTAMMPGFLLYRLGIHWSVSALVGVAAAVSLAVIPSRIAAPQAERILHELTSSDFRKQLPHRPHHIELVEQNVGYVRDGDDPIEHAPCNEICQRLLLTRQVEVVTVVADALFERPAIIVSYSLQAMSRCPVAFDTSASMKVLRSTTRARIAGLCIVPSRGVGMRDGVRISQKQLAASSLPTLTLTAVSRAGRVEITERRKGADYRRLQVTEVEVGSASVPFFVFGYAGILTTVSGTGISKVKKVVNPQAFLASMEDLGFSLVAQDKRRAGTSLEGMIFYSDEPLRPDRSMVASILSQPGQESFSYDLETVVNQWIGSLDTEKTAALEDEDISVLHEAILDRRIIRLTGLNTLLRERPELMDVLIGPILTRLAWPVNTPRFDRDRALAVLVAKQDEASTAINSAPILAIVRGRLSRNTSPLLVSTARLGAEAIPAVLAGLASSDIIVSGDALDAACRMPDAASQFLPVIHARLRESASDAGRLNVPRAIVAVAALEGADAAEAAIGRQPTRNRKQLNAVLDRVIVDGAVQCFQEFG